LGSFVDAALAIKISLFVAIIYFDINIPAWVIGTIVDITLPTFIEQGVKSWV
jgi:hypothetical protein